MTIYFSILDYQVKIVFNTFIQIGPNLRCHL